MMIRVAIVEDDPVWLSLIEKYLDHEEDLEVVATAATKEDAIAFVDNNVSFDVVLMDINLSGNRSDGITAALQICERTKAKVVMLSAHSEKDLITDSFSAGACDFVRKRDFKGIPAAIRTAHNDTTPMEVLLEDYRMLKEIDMIKDLTPCEREILTLSMDGHSRAAIQEMLYKSENTIKTQIKSLLKKLKVGTLQEAVRRIRNRGVV